MAKGSIGILVFLSGAMAVVVVRQASAMREVRQEVAQLREKIEKAERRPRDPAKESLREVFDEIARVEKKAEARAGAAAAETPGAPGALPTLVTEEEIQKIVDDRLEQKVEAKLQARGEGKGGDDRKMPLHDMAKELALDPAVQAKVAEIANASKKDIFSVITTPRANGTNFADDILDAVLKGDPAGMQQIFLRLFSEKIPGTDTTYAMSVQNIQQKAHQQLQGAMGADAYTRYKHMQVNPENIQTGYDPLAEYVTQKGIDPSKFGR